ncbi:Zip-domain-containing protein [Lentithecium fluviatile CBS 122367]|uniref:Zip-domain-containing protein n=1 Tax=Lentithecium fluviatile CBS 122367 TaxID=1168545 RepID=A0A6G1IM78_9PLEO|nr:Zip-domain-containing protein [Lentithecium fluviatile CBS 122367]
MVGTQEYQIVGPTATEEMEAQYTDCHTHGSETFCVNSAGDDVEILVETEETHTEEDHDHDHEETSSTAESEGQNCHFHAGVEHCTGGATATCERVDREYNKNLRVGLLFVILATSSIGVFSPIFAASFTRMSQKSIIFVTLKQFGTGIILSTAFIHLFTHADLMFGNECLGELSYEGTTAAIFLAGLFLSFLVDYLGARFVLWRQSKKSGTDTERPSDSPDAKSSPSRTPDSAISHEDQRGTHVHMHSNAEEKLNVLVLEAGIIFHSLLIGLTLVVAGDSGFITLFVVILFHQMFEGIALGTCIAGLSSKAATLTSKLLLATGFALVTPIGMAIGIGVLDFFNGSDPSTIVAIGTLDALSAGILAWVGIVEMLARDWMQGGLLNARWLKTGVAMLSLVSGMVLMSLLGKWA